MGVTYSPTATDYERTVPSGKDAILPSTSAAPAPSKERTSMGDCRNHFDNNTVSSAASTRRPLLGINEGAGLELHESIQMPGNKKSIHDSTSKAGAAQNQAMSGWKGTINILDSLRASTWEISAPLLILAGPGSGKTQTFAMRVAHLVHSGVPPRSILGFTFTRAAVAEMRDRVRRFAGAANQGGATSTAESKMVTFHSFALHVCKTYGEVKGLQVFGRGQCIGVLVECILEMNLSQDDAQGRSGISEADAKAQAQRAMVSFMRGKAKPGGVAEILKTEAGVLYGLYRDRMARYSAVDFHDLLLNATTILSKPHIAQLITKEYTHILVDEFQDVTSLQFELLRSIVPHGRITVVGDDDQSIYGFAGAEQGVCTRFLHQWESVECVQLGKNHRSQPQIVGACSELIGHNRARFSKRLWSELPEGDKVGVKECRNAACEVASVAAQMRALKAEGGRWDSMAVLLRTRALVAEMIRELKQLGVPVRANRGAMGSIGDEEADADAVLVLAWMRLACREDDDVSCAMVLRDPLLSLGEGSVFDIRSRSRREGVSLWVACRSMQTAASSLFGDSARSPQLPESEAKRLRAASGLLMDLQERGRKGEMPEQIIIRILERSFEPGQGAKCTSPEGWSSRRCYKCQKSGHFMSNCPVDVGRSSDRGRKKEIVVEKEQRHVDGVKLPIAMERERIMANGTASSGGLDMQSLSPSVRGLILSARNYEFEALGLTQGKRKAASDGKVEESSTLGTPNTTKRSKHWPSPSMPSSLAAVSEGLKAGWGAMSKSARKGHNDSMVKRVQQRNSQSLPQTPVREEKDGVSGTPLKTGSPAQAADRQKEVSLFLFLEWLTASEVEGPSPHRGTEVDQVVVTTIHQAKGLEWDTVFLCRINEGVLPLDFRGSGGDQDEDTAFTAHVEEERRLLYVGMSRARKELQISYAATDSTKQQALHPSRFIIEIGKKHTVPSHQYESSFKKEQNFVSARNLPR